MKAIHPIKAAVALSVLTMIFHTGWAALVATGFAQTLIDFVFRLHFIKPVYQIAPFDLVHAVGLVVFVGIAGFAGGLLFATLWNRLHLN